MKAPDTIDLPPLPDDDRLLQTRNAWHALAEHVLAPACHDTARRIGLVVVPGGFGTPPFERGHGPEEVHVVGHELVVHRDARRDTRPISTVREAAAFVGVTPGTPTEVFRPSQPLELDRALTIDDDAATAFGQWFALCWAVLTELRVSTDADDAPSPVQLWPEHLDAAVELGNVATMQRGTFGASLGDADHRAPYLYVTHWGNASDDPFWNDTAFGGASRSYDEVRGAPDPPAAVREFFATGRTRLRAL